jgi:CAP-Gly domain-containing linker protein 1
MGKHNGKIEGVRYFRCQHRYGIFAPLRHVEKVILNPRDSQAFARDSMMSTGSYNQSRDLSSPGSNPSELSTSTDSLKNTSAQSPNKTRQRNSSKETSSSVQILSLIQDLAQKDVFIEKLQQQNNKDRFELSNISEKINEMEIHIQALQHQYDIKENENKHLIKQHHELTQRLEDLQFQLQEDDFQEDHLKIPDNHRLLSLNEIAVYEKTKDKVIELETINQNLIYEKQIFQEELKRYHELKEKEKLTNELIEELKKQIELLKSQLIDLRNEGNH